MIIDIVEMSFRLIAITSAPRPDVSAESLMWTLVRLFGNPHESGLRQRCTRLIQNMGIWQPELRDLVVTRKRELDQAVQGMCTIVHHYLKSPIF